MRRVTSTEFQQSVGACSDDAMREPVVITSHNRDRLVLLDINEYNRLKSLEDEMKKGAEAQIHDILDTHSETFTELANR